MKYTFKLFTALLLGAIVLGAATIAKDGGLSVGDKAPDFKLKNIDGKMLSLADFKEAKGFIVNFTCNTCPVAKLYEERVVELQEKFEPMGYPVINIMPNDVSMKPGDSFENMQKRAKELGYKYYVIDEQQEVFPKYGAERTPHVFILDKDLVVQYIGAIDDNMQDADAVEEKFVEDAIAALEKGKTPDPSFTKAVGCSIKVKK